MVRKGKKKDNLTTVTPITPITTVVDGSIF